jgi:hypothetical protein
MLDPYIKINTAHEWYEKSLIKKEGSYPYFRVFINGIKDFKNPYFGDVYEWEDEKGRSIYLDDEDYEIEKFDPLDGFDIDDDDYYRRLD